MNDPFVMGESSASAICIPNSTISSTGSALPTDVVAERSSLEQFHGDERPTVRFVDLVNGANVRVIQSGRGSGFTPEAFERSGILNQVGGKKL